MSEYAPIVLFVFRRPEHTARLLESLARNAEIAQSTLYVYCEGPRHEADQAAVAATRQLVRAYAHAGTLHVIERERNLGCAASIVAGIDEVLARHDRIIVLEDDLVLSRHFLAYMNAALTRYATSERVMHVSGYMFPRAESDSDRALCLPMTSSWGWGTWRRAWSAFDRDLQSLAWLDASAWRRFRFDVWGAYPYRAMLEQYRRGTIDAWDIRWYLGVFRRGGLGIFPGKSLVANSGFDLSGTHDTDPAFTEPVAAIADRRVSAWPAAASVRFADRMWLTTQLSRGLSWTARLRALVRELVQPRAPG